MLNTPAPHSWPASNWPREVYPNSTSRARWLMRRQMHELIAAGAITRVGRKVVILGEGYTAWLRGKAAAVKGFRNGAAVSKDLRLQ